MTRKLMLFLGWLLFVHGRSYGSPLLETEGLLLGMENYFMSDLISFNNTLDLDSGNSQDSVTYFGIDYSLAFTLEFKQKGRVVFLKFERNGLYDYDAPLFIEDELIVAGPSRVEAYRNKELLPQIEEFWVDLPVAYTPLRFKTGLFAYEVGKGFAQ